MASPIPFIVVLLGRFTGFRITLAVIVGFSARTLGASTALDIARPVDAFAKVFAAVEAMQTFLDHAASISLTDFGPNDCMNFTKAGSFAFSAGKYLLAIARIAGTTVRPLTAQSLPCVDSRS